MWVSGESGWYLVSHPRHIGAEARRGRGGHKQSTRRCIQTGSDPKLFPPHRSMMYAATGRRGIRPDDERTEEATSSDHQTRDESVRVFFLHSTPAKAARRANKQTQTLASLLSSPKKYSLGGCMSARPGRVCGVAARMSSNAGIGKGNARGRHANAKRRRRLLSMWGQPHAYAQRRKSAADGSCTAVGRSASGAP